MNPLNGENPPTLSNSTSHAFRSLNSNARSQLAIAFAFSFSSRIMRSINSPPCGSINPFTAAYARVPAGDVSRIVDTSSRTPRIVIVVVVIGTVTVDAPTTRSTTIVDDRVIVARRANSRTARARIATIIASIDAARCGLKTKTSTRAKRATREEVC
jgi:hypothetical protein